MEKQKINIKYYIYCVICTFLFMFGVLVFVTLLMPMDKYFNPEQEIVDERFTTEYPGTLIIYHDNELNVTCYSSANGLSCIPDAEI